MYIYIYTYTYMDIREFTHLLRNIFYIWRASTRERESERQRERDVLMCVREEVCVTCPEHAQS